MIEGQSYVISDRAANLRLIKQFMSD